MNLLLLALLLRLDIWQCAKRIKFVPKKLMLDYFEPSFDMGKNKCELSNLVI